jgi:hypothetical protein
LSKKWSKSCQTVVKKFVKKAIKKLSKSCQNYQKIVKNFVAPGKQQRKMNCKGPFPLAFFARVSPSAMAPPPNCSLCFSLARSLNKCVKNTAVSYSWLPAPPYRKIENYGRAATPF